MKDQNKDQKNDYYFGGIKEFNLEQIEAEVLNENIYLDVFAGSDLRLKRNVQPIENALEKIMQLGGVTFEWDSSQVPANWGNPASGVQAGLIAQEVAAVAPEIVRKDAGSGFLTLDYGKVSSYLVEALKEMNEQLQRQAEKIDLLEKKLAQRSPAEN